MSSHLLSCKVAVIVVVGFVVIFCSVVVLVTTSYFDPPSDFNVVAVIYRAVVSLVFFNTVSANVNIVVEIISSGLMLLLL